MMVQLDVPVFSPDMAKVCIKALAESKIAGGDAVHYLFIQLALTHIAEGKVICVSAPPPEEPAPEAAVTEADNG